MREFGIITIRRHIRYMLRKTNGRSDMSKKRKLTNDERMREALNSKTRDVPEHVLQMDGDHVCANCAAMDWNPNGKGNWAFCALHGDYLATLFPKTIELGCGSCDQFFS
jgi:hypothetical protein